MDADRIAVQALFPHAMGFAGEKLRFLGAELWTLCVSAYNDFVLSEYCGADRRRLAGVAILPLADSKAAAAEVERVAALGARGVSFPHNPVHLGLPSLYEDHWDPVLDAIGAAGIPLFMHIGTGSPLTTAATAPFEVVLSLATLDALTAMTDLAFSPVLERPPGAPRRPAGGGHQLDPVHDRTHRLLLGPPGSHGRRPGAPSRRLRRQVLAAFIDDPAGMSRLDDVGAERVLWMSDFPHPDSAWPDSRSRLVRALDGVADDDAAAIAEGNARALLRLPRAQPAR